MYELIRTRVSRIGGGATNEDLETSPTPSGYVDRVIHLAAEDETTIATYMRSYVRDGDTYHYQEEQRGVSRGVLYHSTDPLEVPGRWRVGVRFNGTTSGDILAVYLAIRRFKVMTPRGEVQDG